MTFVILISAVISLGAADAASENETPDNGKQTCFAEKGGKPLPRFDQICQKLHDFFGSSMPTHITIEFTDAYFSRFSPDTSTVKISARHYQQKPFKVIAHEAAHIAMARLTQSSSLRNKFRFIDEGYASVFSNDVAGKREWHKAYSLQIAAREHRTQNVSFLLVQDWRRYWGDTRMHSGRDRSKFSDYAYSVGASFVYFFLDSFGENAFLKFLKNLPGHGSIHGALINSLGLTSTEVERLWLGYLAAVALEK
jgi:hypothetical protein